MGLAAIESVLRLREFAAGDIGLPHDHATGLEAVDTSDSARELIGIGWVVVFLVTIWLVGFLLATGLFLFGFLRIVGARSWRYATGAALAAVGIVWFVFAFLLEYRLFGGLLFGA